jgi:hypothetical protein
MAQSSGNNFLYFPSICPGLFDAKNQLIRSSHLLIGWRLDACTIIVAGAVDENFDQTLLDREDDLSFLSSSLSNVKRFTNELKVEIVGKICLEEFVANLPINKSIPTWVDITLYKSDMIYLPRIIRFIQGSAEANKPNTLSDHIVNSIVMYSIPDAMKYEYLSSSSLSVIPKLHTFGTVSLSSKSHNRIRRTSLSGHITSSFSIPASHRFRLILRLLNSAGFTYSIIHTASKAQFISTISSTQSSKDTSTTKITTTTTLQRNLFQKGLLLFIRIIVFPLLLLMLFIRLFFAAIFWTFDCLNFNQYLKRKILENNISIESSSKSTLSPLLSINSNNINETTTLFNHSLSILAISSFARQLNFKIQIYSQWPFYLKNVQETRNRLKRSKLWPVTDELEIENSSEEKGLIFGGQELLFLHVSTLSDTTWRFIIDSLLGICLFYICHRNEAIVARSLVTYSFRLFHLIDTDVLRSWVAWLLEFPAGLKLNLYLGRRLGGLILFVIDFWKKYLEQFCNFLVADKNLLAKNEVTVWIILAITTLGLGGASLIVALSIDIISFLTVHIKLLRSVFAFLHRQFLSILGTLFLLIRGKKRNVLRERVDTLGFGDSPPEALAHLMLGVILFAISFFLFPTAAVYYFFLTSLCICIVVFKGILLAVLTILNNVPLYAPFCSIFCPRRVPGGIDVQLFKHDGVLSEQMPKSTLEISSNYVHGTPLYVYLAEVEKEEKRQTLTSSKFDLWFKLESKTASTLSLLSAPFVSAYKRLLKYHLQPTQIFNAIVLGHSFQIKRTFSREDTSSTPLPTVFEYWKILLDSIDVSIQNIVDF